MKIRKIFFIIIVIMIFGIFFIVSNGRGGYPYVTESSEQRDVIKDAENYFVANKEYFEELYDFLSENYNISDYDEIKALQISDQRKVTQKDFWIYIFRKEIQAVLEDGGKENICNWYEADENLGTIDIDYRNGKMQWISIDYYDTGNTTAGMQFYKIVDETYDVRQRLLQYMELGDGWYVLYAFGV